MAILNLNGKEIETRIGYKQLKKLETYYPGLSFEQVIAGTLSNPSLSDLERVIYISLVGTDMTVEEFGEELDTAFNSQTLTFEELIDILDKSVDESVFLKGLLETKTETEKKADSKAELKKAKVI